MISEINECGGLCEWVFNGRLGQSAYLPELTNGSVNHNQKSAKHPSKPHFKWKEVARFKSWFRLKQKFLELFLIFPIFTILQKHLCNHIKKETKLR